MTLKKGNSADLELNIDVHEKAVALKYEYDEELFTLDKKVANILDKGFHKKGDTLNIKCIQEFSEDKEIRLYAYDEKKEKSLSGKLIIKANDKKHCYALNVVLVRVKTCIVGDIISYPSENSSRKEMLERYFSQCYIEANIEECDLDLTTQLRKKSFLAYTKGGFLIESKIDDQTLFTYLINELRNDPKTKQYTDYYKLFCIDEEVEKKTLNGQARNISKKEAIISKNGLDKETIVHELFLCLGLYHSFSLKNKYIFEKYKTDNLNSAAFFLVRRFYMLRCLFVALYVIMRIFGGSWFLQTRNGVLSTKLMPVHFPKRTFLINKVKGTATSLSNSTKRL